MIGIYFSGTGNTKHCLKVFMNEIEQGALCISIEDENAVNAIRRSDSIVLAYPIYFSNPPKIMRDFIQSNATLFAKKHIFIIATMGLFSGDGAGVSARLLKKQGAYITGGLHLKMPDCIGDEKAQAKGKCTMCYRCVSNCPKQAITLLGQTLHEQCKIENYL